MLHLAATMENLRNLIHTDINEYYGYAKYLGNEVIIMKQNGYVNISKLCTEHNKKFNDWKRLKRSVELMEFLSASAGIPADGLVLNPSEKIDLRGSYVHPEIAPDVAAWISPIIGITVSRIVNSFQVRELREQIDT